jgi:adenylosuccinate lyase
VMRRYAVDEPYEKLKALTRGRYMDRNTIHAFVADLDIPDHAKQTLMDLTPGRYTGNAAQAARSQLER